MERTDAGLACAAFAPWGWLGEAGLWDREALPNSFDTARPLGTLSTVHSHGVCAALLGATLVGVAGPGV